MLDNVFWKNVLNAWIIVQTKEEQEQTKSFAQSLARKENNSQKEKNSFPLPSFHIVSFTATNAASFGSFLGSQKRTPPFVLLYPNIQKYN